MDKSTIEYVANLSRLKLTENEKELFQNQLIDIFKYINKLNELDTENVIPMTNGINISNVFRKDLKVASISKQHALQNSPSKTSDFFKVPQILD